MPAPDHEMTLDEREAASRETLRLAHVAMVHICLRTPKNPPRRRTPKIDFDSASDDERTLYLTYLISNWLGQAERCTQSRCRRAKLCRGDPPDCWSEEPPPTPLELDLAKGMMKLQVGEALRDARQREAEAAARRPAGAADTGPVTLAGRGS
jgi:hypothetical protein